MTGGADALQEEQFLGMYLAFYQTIFFAGKSMIMYQTQRSHNHTQRSQII